MTLKTDKPREVQDVEFALGQLRHAYEQLVHYRVAVPHQKEFAEGLLGPAIAVLERAMRRSTLAMDPQKPLNFLEKK